MGAGDLEVLGGLPHTAAYVGASDRERQVRLLRHLRAELERRRGARTRTGARTVVLLDGLGALREELDDADGLDLLDDLYRVYADGPAVGISFAVAADRAAAVPSAVTAVTPQKWLLRLADPHDYSTCGLHPRSAPPPVPGRAAVAATGQHVHVGTPSVPWADEVGRIAALWAHEPARPPAVGVLPTEVLLPSLGAVAEVGEEPWRIPVGVRESDLGTGELVLYEGEHALVAGPSRSGKSTVLLALAAALRHGADESGSSVQLAGAGGRRSPLAGSTLLDRYAGSPGDLAVLVAQLRTSSRPVALLVDDCDTFDDADGALAGLLAAGLPELHVLCAGRTDSLRSLYGHWTKTVRMSRTGLLLQPNVDLDGDLLGVTLPRRAPVALSEGRGYLVQYGDVHLVQAARPA
jgi:S-DNA-T family DNA segregation ATPase FtsK/SpoIIIE